MLWYRRQWRSCRRWLRSVKPVQRQKTAGYLFTQKAFFFLHFGQHALVLSRSPTEVWQYFFHRTVWHVLEDRITSLTWTVNTTKLTISKRCSSFLKVSHGWTLLDFYMAKSLKEQKIIILPLLTIRSVHYKSFIQVAAHNKNLPCIHILNSLMPTIMNFCASQEDPDPSPVLSRHTKSSTDNWFNSCWQSNWPMTGNFTPKIIIYQVLPFYA